MKRARINHPERAADYNERWKEEIKERKTPAQKAAKLETTKNWAREARMNPVYAELANIARNEKHDVQREATSARALELLTGNGVIDDAFEFGQTPKTLAEMVDRQCIVAEKLIHESSGAVYEALGRRTIHETWVDRGKPRADGGVVGEQLAPTGYVGVTAVDPEIEGIRQTVNDSNPTYLQSGGKHFTARSDEFLALGMVVTPLKILTNAFSATVLEAVLQAMLEIYMRYGSERYWKISGTGVVYTEHKTSERLKIAAGKNVAYTVFLTTMRIKSFSENPAGDVNGVTALSGQQASITDDNSSTYSQRSTRNAFLGVACSAPLP